MDFTADLDIFFVDSDATMSVGVGTPFPVIFNQSGKEVQLFDGSVMSSEPFALVKTADATGNVIDNETAVTVTSASMGLTAEAFIVASLKPDGLGLSIITLTKA